MEKYWFGHDFSPVIYCIAEYQLKPLLVIKIYKYARSTFSISKQEHPVRRKAIVTGLYTLADFSLGTFLIKFSTAVGCVGKHFKIRLIS